MPATLQTAPATWQGLRIRVRYDIDERPLSPTAQLVTDELLRLGKHMPATVLLAAMERRGYDDPSGLLIDALTDAPYAFTVSRL
jgi:hypothetical protein